MLKDNLQNLCEKNYNIYDFYGEINIYKIEDIKNIMEPEFFEEYLLELKRLNNYCIFGDFNNQEQEENIKNNIINIIKKIKK